MDAPARPPSPSPEQPLGVFQSLTAALKVYFANANTLFVIVAIFVIPATIVTFLVIRWAVGDWMIELAPGSEQDPFAGLERAEVVRLVVAFTAGVVLNFVISMIAVGACFQAVHQALEGIEPDRRSSVRAALDKVGSLVWLPLLIGLLFLVASLLGAGVIGLLGTLNDSLGAIAGLLLFGALVYFFVSWSVAVPVLMAEDRRGMQAVTRSHRLVRGRWWPTFGLYALAFLLIIVVSALLGEVFKIDERSGTEGLVLGTLSSVVSNVIFTPLQAALIGVAYMNLVVAERRSGQTGDHMIDGAGQ